MVETVISKISNLPVAVATTPGGREVASAEDLTQHELLGLRKRFNLADAHTHQRQSPSQESIIERLPQLWHEAERLPQFEIEERFLAVFFELHGQRSAPAMRRSLLSYSASTSMSVIGMYLAASGMSVSLIEPTFDNLPDLLRKHGVGVSAIPEHVFSDPATVRSRLDDYPSDVLYLVDPNNPTGSTAFYQDGQLFGQVLEHCRERGRLLVLDFCFASFALRRAPHHRGDVYRQLEDAGVSYLALEDTGKTWPTQDAKCAILTASADLFRDIFTIHTALLLNVSPFVLKLATEYVLDSQRDELASVMDLLEVNRDELRNCVRGTGIELMEPQVNTSVGWLRINSPVPASVLHQRLSDRGIYLLPGTYFYWSDHTAGERNLRVALARDQTMFEEAMRLLRQLLLDRSVMS